MGNYWVQSRDPSSGVWARRVDESYEHLIDALEMRDKFKSEMEDWEKTALVDFRVVDQDGNILGYRAVT